nr:MAG TPA: TM Leucine-rich repeat family 19 TM domain [Caudoviricetes sp.]
MIRLHIVVSYTATKLGYTTKFVSVISVIICISYLIAIITKCGLW